MKLHLKIALIRLIIYDYWLLTIYYRFVLWSIVLLYRVIQKYRYQFWSCRHLVFSILLSNSIFLNCLEIEHRSRTSLVEIYSENKLYSINISRKLNVKNHNSPVKVHFMKQCKGKTGIHEFNLNIIDDNYIIRSAVF